MDAIRLNISGVWSDKDFPMSQAVVEADGRRVHLTGQVGWTSDFEMIGPNDAGAQTHAAIAILRRFCLPWGGTIEDVVSTTMYYVRDDDLPAIQDARRSRFSFSADPAVTGVKVASHVDPQLLVELTVMAVIPNARFRSTYS